MKIKPAEPCLIIVRVMGGKGNLSVHKGNRSISHVENYNADDCCDQDDYNEELDNVVFFKKEFRVTGEQKNKSQHGKRHVYIVISPFSVILYMKKTLYRTRKAPVSIINIRYSFCLFTVKKIKIQQIINKIFETMISG